MAAYGLSRGDDDDEMMVTMVEIGWWGGDDGEEAAAGGEGGGDLCDCSSGLYGTSVPNSSLEAGSKTARRDQHRVQDSK
ncbi:hypothetical protein Tco_0410549 [Tanacetum coccineum]